jgi:hypothetical protein
MFSFKQSAIAQVIAKAIPLIFCIYFLAQKDFKTKYPQAANIRPQMIIVIIALIALTIYQYVIK